MGPLTFFHQHRPATMNLGTITVKVKPFLRSCLDSRLVSLTHVPFFFWRYIFSAFVQRGSTLSVIPAVSSNTPEVHGLWKTVAIHLRRAQAQRCWQTLWMLVIYGFHFGQVLTCIFADSVTSCGFCRVMCVLRAIVIISRISSSRNIMHLRLCRRARHQLCLKCRHF